MKKNLFKYSILICFIFMVIPALVACGSQNTEDEDAYTEELLSYFYSIIEEAEGNSKRMQMLMDYADEIGYSYSLFWGTWFYDSSDDNNWIVHHSASEECIMATPLENIVASCQHYRKGFDISSHITDTPALSKHNCSLCPVCFPGK